MNGFHKMKEFAKAASLTLTCIIIAKMWKWVALLLYSQQYYTVQCPLCDVHITFQEATLILSSGCHITLFIIFTVYFMANNGTKLRQYG
jgi:hypothetical protein